MNRKHTLCWECAKATTGECCWSRGDDFGPVDGWEAEPVRIRINAKTGQYVDTFIVTKCPEFRRDAYEFGLRRMDK